VKLVKPLPEGGKSKNLSAESKQMQQTV
jgi:hypothetical protein